jgi:peptidoglycan/xylan/chitin deacetylase (PgdA/CDA1 family)
MKKVGRRFGRAILLFLGLFFLFVTSAAARGIPVLLYHQVDDQKTEGPLLTVSTTEFSRQLHLLRTHGFQTITLPQLRAYMRGEQVDLPDKPFLITFDDGYRDNYSQAFPVLKEVGYCATIFMVGNNFDRGNRLTSSQIREMNANGFSAGAHSMTHPDLTQLSASKLQAEVMGSKKKVEAVIHAEVGYFAYPGGFYNLAVVEAVEAAGFQGGFSILPGLNHPERDNLYLLRRFPIFSYTKFDQLLKQLLNPSPQPSLLDF